MYACRLRQLVPLDTPPSAPHQLSFCAKLLLRHLLCRTQL